MTITHLPAVPMSIAEIVETRNNSLRTFTRAYEGVMEARQLGGQALAMLRTASSGGQFYEQRESRRHYIEDIIHGRDHDREKTIAAYRHKLDASIWQGLVDKLGLRDMMDHETKKKWDAGLAEDAPEVTETNILATFEHMIDGSGEMFRAGLANCFSKLDRRFKSHDVFKLGDRIIIERLFDDWGYYSWSCWANDALIDIERVFAKLDDQAPDPNGLREAIRESREGQRGARQSVAESRYFRVKGFKNGNAHLWFTRPDLVKKVNKELAAYYGEVLPDATEKEETIRTGTEVAKDLQYYPTPQAAVDYVMEHGTIYRGGVFLEPSAGDGQLVRGILSKLPEADVTAVEVNPQLVARLMKTTPRANVEVHQTNFLSMPVQQKYDCVVMNPPFYGTHWMDHVMHAYEFLVPGGSLNAILPATAEVGTSKRHKQFQKWFADQGLTTKYETYERHFRDMPSGSFKESGTNVNTVLLTLRKPN